MIMDWAKKIFSGFVISALILIIINSIGIVMFGETFSERFYDIVNTPIVLSLLVFVVTVSVFIFKKNK